MRDLIGSVGTGLTEALATGDRGRVIDALRPELDWAEHPTVRRAHVEAAYEKIMAESAGHVRPVGPATIQRIHATLRKALNDAVRERRLTDNPARHVELPRSKRSRPLAWTRLRVLQWMATGKRPTVAV